MAASAPQQQSNHNSDYRTQKAKIICCLPPCKNSLLTLALEDSVEAFLYTIQSNIRLFLHHYDNSSSYYSSSIHYLRKILIATHFIQKKVKSQRV